MKLFPEILDACEYCKGGDCGDCFGGCLFNGDMYGTYKEAENASQDFLKHLKDTNTLAFCDVCGNECFLESSNDNNTTCTTCQQKEAFRKKIHGFMKSIVKEFNENENGYDCLKECLYETMNDVLYERA